MYTESRKQSGRHDSISEKCLWGYSTYRREVCAHGLFRLHDVDAPGSSVRSKWHTKVWPDYAEMPGDCLWLGWSHRSLLVFHVGHISDRRVIKAAINARPFPVLLSYRPTGQRRGSGMGFRISGGGVGAPTTISLMDFPRFLWLWTWKCGGRENRVDAGNGKSSDLLWPLIGRQ